MLGNEAGSVKGRVKSGASMAFGENDSVIKEVFGVVGVELESLLMEK